MKVYVANEVQAGIGHVTCSNGLERQSASLLVSPRVRTFEELTLALAQLRNVIGRQLPADGSFAGHGSGAMGSIAISFDPHDIAGTKREGPIFGSPAGWPALVAFVVDTDRDPAAESRFEVLASCARDRANGLLTPLPVRRTIHHAEPHSWGPDGAACGHHERTTEQLIDQGVASPAPAAQPTAHELATKQLPAMKTGRHPKAPPN